MRWLEMNCTAVRPFDWQNPRTWDELEMQVGITHVRQGIEHGVSLFNGNHDLFHSPARCDDETLVVAVKITAHASNLLMKYRIHHGGDMYATVGPWPHDI